MKHSRCRSFAHLAATALVALCAVAFPAVASAAPSLRGTAGNGVTNSSTLTLPKPTAVAAGDVLLAVVDVRLSGAQSVTGPTGWTLIRRDANASSGASLSQAVYYRVATSTEPDSYTWSFSPKSSSAVGGIFAYSGVDNTSPVISHSGRTSTKSTRITAPSVALPGGGVAIIAFFGDNGLNDTSAPTGMTERWDRHVSASDGVTSAADDTVLASSSGSTGDKTAFTKPWVSTGIGQLIALRAAPSVSTPTKPSATSLPTISGTAQQDSTLTGAAGTWSGTAPITYGYQWNRCSGGTCSPIAGATSTTYLLTSTDVGSTITFSVTGTNSAGSTTATSSPTQAVAAPPSSGGTGGSGSTGTVGTSLPTPLPASSGAVFYVSPTGLDTNPGTQTSPWRTIQKALNTLLPGQTAYVLDGTYSEWLIWSLSGTATAPITLKAAPGTRPVLTGRLKIQGSYVRVSGFKFLGGTAANPSDVCIYVAGGDHDELSDNEITAANMSGIFLSGADDDRIIGNWIHNNGTHWNQDHGIYYDDGVGGLIANNRIEANEAFGVHLYPAPDKVIVTNNTITANQRAGVIVDGANGQAPDNVLIVDNIVAYNGEMGIRSGSTVGTNDVARNNLVYGNPGGNLWGQLTFTNNTTADPQFVSYSADDLHLQSSSPARDTADTSYAYPVDYDGRVRTAPDLGAFEY
jgi:hypothetical protein